MNKINYRSVLMVFLMVASLASYTFLSFVEVENIETTVEEINIEILDTTPEVFMPDVELVKKAFKISKSIFHPFSK